MTNTKRESGTTRESDATPTAVKQPRRRWRRAVWLVLALLVVAGFAWIWNPAQRYAQTGASYGARVACSCRYLGGRTLNDCHKDMEGATSWVSLSDDPQSRSVTANFLFLARQTATYREGWGCQLQPWTGGH
jgi:hypothetical protein